MSVKKIALGVLMIVLVVALVYWARNYLQIDSCLDQGGRWNYEKSVCEYSNNK